MEIDIRSSYKWNPNYLPLYRGLVKKKNEGELTKEERELIQWLSYSLVDYCMKERKNG
jgi:hypothetical protein